MEGTASNAQNRDLVGWYNIIKNGQIKLPRFQRMEAWDRGRIESFLDTIIHNLPVGVSLVLKVGDEERFESKYIATANKISGESVNEHLLDGQQRLTAFWRAIHNNYPHETYFVYFPEYENYYESPWNDDITVYCRSRYMINGNKYPLWTENPKETFKRGCIPFNLFRPDNIQSEIDEWIDAATKHLEPSDDDPDAFSKLKKFNKFQKGLLLKINKHRDIVAHFNFPYLSLPVTTHKDIALQVFINMNTNSKPLSIYDIIVAEVESEKGESLHRLTKDLDEKYPNIKHFFDLEFLILATSALLQDKLPNHRGMVNMKKPKMVENWDTMEACLNRMAIFLETQGIYDRQRLPTNAVLAVIAACYSNIPDSGDIAGKGDLLLKKYLWSSFFTDRYENAAATRAYADYIALRNVLKSQTKEDGTQYTEKDVPVLNRNLFPLVDEAELLTISWPKKVHIRARGILAVSTYLGALDFADGQQVTRDNILKREYHHIFPKALLQEANIENNYALNCALISAPTNRSIGRKEPLQYLKDRYEWVDEEIIHERLNSHLVPIKELKSGEYDSLTEEDRTNKIKNDYKAFLKARSKLIVRAVDYLLEGRNITPSMVLSDAPQKSRKELWHEKIQKGKETKTVEFKSTLRYCLHRKTAAPDIELSSFKNIAAFLNSEGGELFIGVDDDGNILGLENDFNTFTDDNKIDSFSKHFDNLVSKYFGDEKNRYLELSFPIINDKQIAVITVKGKAQEEIWLNNKQNKSEQFFIRRSASTKELTPKEANQYIKEHWD